MPGYSHLLDEERDQIAVMKAAGCSLGAIARTLARLSKRAPEEDDHHGVERRHQHRSGEIRPQRLQTHGLKPPSEVAAEPRHEIIEQQDARRIADEERGCKGQTGPSRQDGLVDENAEQKDDRIKH